MNPDHLFNRFQQLQAYIGWTDADAQQILAIAALAEPHLRGIVDDFYAEISRHPEVRKVITGGPEQVERLKGTLTWWLRELWSGAYDQDYVWRRWQVGWRHVEIGLDQVYVNAALARIRSKLCRAVRDHCIDNVDVSDALIALNKLLDLDLAIISSSYQSEYASRKEESQKRRSEAAFRSLVEAAPCMIVIMRADGTVRYFSPYAEVLTGYQSDEVLGKSYFTIFIRDPSRQEAIQLNMKQVLAGQVTRDFENPVVCKDGSQRVLLWNAQHLDYEGEAAVLAVGHDITRLKESQEKLLQAERLAAIGQMMAGLAHESGNALARSHACLEMLALEVEDRPEALELIGRVQKAQDSLRHLYDEVRGYAAPLRLDRDLWDVGAIWRQAWENLAVQRLDRDACLLEEEMSQVDLCCAVDQFRLEQVFRNIFENSLAACKDQVRISITCSRTELDGSPALQIVVKDNGPGLSAEQKRNIFDPFFTTKSKGTGLGMAIARHIVEAHRGRIAAGPAGQSTGHEHGAEIVITLPWENQ